MSNREGILDFEFDNERAKLTYLKYVDRTEVRGNCIVAYCFDKNRRGK